MKEISSNYYVFYFSIKYINLVKFNNKSEENFIHEKRKVKRIKYKKGNNEVG